MPFLACLARFFRVNDKYINIVFHCLKTAFFRVRVLFSFVVFYSCSKQRAQIYMTRGARIYLDNIYIIGYRYLFTI